MRFTQMRREMIDLSDKPTRRDRHAIAVAAAAVGVPYGPSECRPDEKDGVIYVQTDALTVSEQAVPVQWVMTNNRGILEKQA